MPFNGIPNLRDANEPVKIDIDKLREIKKCAIDPIYFIRNYVYINTKDNGMQLFDLYDFQEAALKRFLKYRFNINKWSRQVGKSTVVRGFILWWGIFHKDQLIAMIGNKLSLAKEQMQQLRDSYSRLPVWLQPGVKLWNKTSIQFSNNSRIIVSSSSPDNIRGFSINLLYLDEFAFLRPNLATEFIASVMPSISSGKTTRCIITSCVTKDTMVCTPDGIRTVGDYVIDDGRLMGYEVPEYQVLGRYGMNKGHIMHNDGRKTTRIVKTRYTELECSLMHKWWICRDGEYSWKRAHELKVGDYVMVKYGMNCWGNDYIGYKHKTRSNGKEYKNAVGDIDYITPDIAYLFGLYIAEGNISDVPGRQSLFITIGDDVSPLFKKLGLNYYCNNDNLHYQICNADLVSLFKFVGFDLSLHAKQKVIPPRLMRMSKECTVAMIQGMMDGDGCATTKKCMLNYTSTSYQLIKQLRMLLLNFGILSTLREHDTPPTKKVKVWSHSWVLEVSSSSMVSKYFDEIGFRLDRKMAKRETQIKHSSKAAHYDIIPFSAPVIRRLKKTKVITNDVFKLTGGICRKGQEHLSRSLVLDIKSKLPADVIAAEPIFQNAEPDCYWCPITRIDTGEADVFDFSLNDDNYGGPEWTHSVIYNGNTAHNTPNGHNHFYDMWQTSLELDQAEAEFEKGNNDLYVRSVVTWDKVPGRTEAWAKAEKVKIGDQRFRQEYECEFVGSGITLIDYRCLETLKASDPLPFDNSIWPPALAEIVKDISIRTFKYPEPAGAMEAKGYSYAASIDTAYGMRQDYHVLQITKVYSNIKCEQVFTMSSNCTEVSDFCRIANIILKFYHNPYLIIEYNGPGKSTYDYFFNVAMYPNIINFDLHLRGLWATPTMKNNVVILLKMYVQRGYIKLHDYNTIMELMTFTKKTQNTWGGGGNTHDDHVTSLYWIIYFLNSTYYYGNFEEIENLSETEMLRLSDEMRNRYADALDFVKSPDAMAEQHKLGAMAEAGV